MSLVRNKLSTIDDLVALKPLVENLEGAVQFLSSQYEDVKNQLAANTEKIGMLQNKLGTTEAQSKAKDVIIKDLQRRVLDMEQHSRNKNIEVSGVEVVEGENLKAIMGKIANAINVAYDEDHIEVVHRVPTRAFQGPPKIIAQFSTRTIRDEWVAKKRSPKVLSKELVGGNSDYRVFIGEHLSVAMKDLLWKTKDTGHPKGYNLIWYKNGKILVKKNVNDRKIIHITCEEDLLKLV